MAGKAAAANSLITSRAPDTTLSVQLHPLVLLTISDYITRHISRQQPGPMIGAIIGQQNGRTFTLEHAYECKLADKSDLVAVDEAWFTDRLQQYKDVHKVPALDLVGVFMMSSTEGPAPAHAALMKQIQELTSNDSLILLTFHPDLVDQLQGGKLPITLYESVQEQEGGAEMELKFRELDFEVETGEAEMIAVDSVATGGGNATAIPKASTTAAPAPASESSSKDKKGKGKAKAKDEDADTNGTNVLSPEDDELIASLTAKANAIKMLNQRINLIREYLKSQQQSYLTDENLTQVSPADDTNYTLLRSINAMLARLPLLAPPSTAAIDTANNTDTISTASDKEKQDVHLTSLLSTLTRSLAEAQSMATKFQVVTREKAARERGPFGGGGPPGRGGRMGFGDEGGFPGGGEFGGGP